MGSLTMLNEAGDTTISWTEDRDEEMQKIIEKKMAEGVTFFIVDDEQPATSRGARLESAKDAKTRTVIIPDEDLQKFVESGAGQVNKASGKRIERTRVSRDAKEVAKSTSVGAKPRRGG